MNTFDNFCSDLFEEAKRFLEIAIESEKKTPPDEAAIHANQHACLLIGMCALEAYLNGISEEMCLSELMPLHEKGILLEKEIRLEKGEFVITNSLKMSRMTDRVELLYKRYKKEELTAEISWWVTLRQGIEARNKITHPKEHVTLTNQFLERVLQAIVDCMSALYRAVYSRDFPKTGLLLASRLSF